MNNFISKFSPTHFVVPEFYNEIIGGTNVKNKYIEILEDTRNYADNMLEYYRREIEKCFLKAEEKIMQKFNMDLDNCRLCYQNGQKDGCYNCTQNNYNFTQYNTNINTAPQNSQNIQERILPNYQNLIPEQVESC